MQPGRIDKMRSRHPQLRGFFIHQIDKRRFAAGFLQRQRLGGIRARRQKQTVKQILDRYDFPRLEPGDRSVRLCQSGEHLRPQRHRAVQRRAFSIATNNVIILVMEAG